MRLHEKGRSEEGIRLFIETWNGVKWGDMSDGLKQRLVALAPQLYQESQAVTYDLQTKSEFLSDCPIHLIEGQRTLLPAAAIIERMRQQFPGSTYTLVENEGHMGPLFNPALYAGILLRFWEALDT